MDERTQTPTEKIRDLETRKREAQRSIAALEENLGRSLLDRMDGTEKREKEPAGAEYRGIRAEIAESETRIQGIEADTLKLRDLEAEIQARERGAAALERDLAQDFTSLGEVLLQQKRGGDDFTAPYERQLEELLPKIQALEERLAGQGDRGNFFNWVGKGAKGVVLKTFLAKNRASLERIYRSAGECFLHLDGDDSAGLGEIFEQTRTKKEELESEKAALVELKNTRRELVAGFEGNPRKRSQDLGRHVSHARERLKVCCRRYGERVARGEAGEGIEIEGEEAAALAGIRELQENIAACDGEIEKIQAALEVEEKKRQIVSLEKEILDHRRRIAASQSAVVALERQIEAVRLRVGELEAKAK